MHNIPLFKVFMADTVADKVKEVLYSGYIGEGPIVVDFEKLLSQFFQHNRVLTVNSGTSGLHLAYHMSLNHDKDAEIISTPITCTATNVPILNNNAKIVWADVDPLSGNIDPADIERKITKKTKAIVMVHWGGNPCDIGRINAIAKDHNLKVIEDAAHSMGSTYKGLPVGNYSDFAAYSLQAIKHITSIDGGILLCKSEDDYQRGRLLRWYGIDRDAKDAKDLRCELDVVEPGYKAHMNDVCATVGIENFKHMQWIVERHQSNAAFYNEAFKNISTITTAPENPDGKSAAWLYTLHANNRDELMDKLKQNGIGASKVHSRNDTHSMFKASKVILPHATKFNDTHLCIPVGWWVTSEEREYIAEQVIKYAK